MVVDSVCLGEDKKLGDFVCDSLPTELHLSQSLLDIQPPQAYSHRVELPGTDFPLTTLCEARRARVDGSRQLLWQGSV